MVCHHHYCNVCVAIVRCRLDREQCPHSCRHLQYQFYHVHHLHLCARCSHYVCTNGHHVLHACRLLLTPGKSLQWAHKCQAVHGSTTTYLLLLRWTARWHTYYYMICSHLVKVLKIQYHCNIEETVNLRKEKVTEMFLKVTERP